MQVELEQEKAGHEATRLELQAALKELTELRLLLNESSVGSSTGAAVEQPKRGRQASAGGFFSGGKQPNSGGKRAEAAEQWAGEVRAGGGANSCGGLLKLKVVDVSLGVDRLWETPVSVEGSRQKWPTTSSW